MKIAIFDYLEITPLKQLGLTSSFWTIHLDTLCYTWCAMLFILLFIFLGRFFMLRRNQSLAALAFENIIGFFIQLCNESFHPFNFKYFAFITALFFFAFFSCIKGLIPFLKEATEDLNTTLALGLTSFMYIQYQKIKVHGIVNFLGEFAQPFFLLFPINVVGELAKIASMSFRLFGNIVGESIIFTMLIQLVDSYKVYFLCFVGITLLLAFLTKKLSFIPHHQRLTKIMNGIIFIMFLLTWAQMFFGIFGGLIQSLVITMLTVTYLAMGTSPEESHQPPLAEPSPQQEECEVYS
jgi:F-type H+-transporting ATPase subunit a